MCHNEYDQLKQVIVTAPTYMRIEEIINETQKHYQESNIDIDKALKQHHYFQKVMRDHGVEVLEIEPTPDLNEQVFTRDIGVTIGEQVIVSQMATDLRERETVYLKKTLTEKSIGYQEIEVDSIEGGDVILDENLIWIGISDRTTVQAVQALQQLLPDYQKLKSHYQLIDIDSEEQFTLGTNVLSIARKKVISLPENKQTNQKLRETGLEVIEVPFNEIIK